MDNTTHTVSCVPLGTVSAAVFQTTGSTLTVLAKTGDVAPSTGGATFTAFDDISQNTSGGVAFIASYTGGGGHSGVFLKPSGGALVKVIKNGDSLPGTGGGTMSAGPTFDIDGPWLNDNGDVAFQPQSVSGGSQAACGGTAGACDESVFIRRANGTVDWLVLIGTSTPWGTINRIGVGRPGMNNKQLGMKLSFGPDTDTAPSVIAFTRIDDHDILNPCAKTGDPDPQATGTFEGFQDPALGENGTLAFSADVRINSTTENTNVYLCHKAFFPGGSDVAVASQGDPKPGGGTFASLEEASIAPNGGKDDPVAFLDDSTGNVYVFKS